MPGTFGRASNVGPLADTVEPRFTGQIRDQDTQLDFFNARYYGSVLGRCTSPDPANAGAVLTAPQTWNAYAYVRNSPLALVDPSGMDDEQPDPCEDDPFLCGWLPFPPPIGDPNQPAPPPPVTVEEPLPPGSFPGGESLGLPPGMGIPGAWGIDPGCEFGPCRFAGAGAPPFVNTSLVNSLIGAVLAARLGFGGGSQALRPSRIRVAVPFWQSPLPRYCGPGTGSGAPVNQVDAACQAHDQCYQDANVSGADIFLPRSAAKTAAMNACDAGLCKRLTTIVPENPTENGDTFFVGLFFSVIHGTLSGCIP